MFKFIFISKFQMGCDVMFLAIFLQSIVFANYLVLNFVLGCDLCNSILVPYVLLLKFRRS